MDENGEENKFQAQIQGIQQEQSAPAEVLPVKAGDSSQPANIIPKVIVSAPDIKNLGKKNVAAVYINDPEKKEAGKCGKVVEFSQQEALVVETFITSGGDHEATAKKAGITVDSVKRMLRRPNLRLFLNAVIEQAAIDTATTPRWVMSTARKVADGQTISDQSWDAVKFIGKMLKPEAAPPGSQVNIQNNYYGGLKKETINAEWAARGIDR